MAAAKSSSVQWPPEEVQVKTLAGDGKAGNKDGNGKDAEFHSPTQCVVSTHGLYVADTGNHRIRVVNTATGQTSTVAGSTQGFADGKGGDAKFNAPQGIALDSDAVGVVVADTGNHCLRRVESDGTVSVIAGQPGKPGGADGLGGAAQFSAPLAVWLEVKTGLLFVADTNGIRTVQKTADGYSVKTLKAVGGVTAITSEPGVLLPRALYYTTSSGIFRLNLSTLAVSVFADAPCSGGVGGLVYLFATKPNSTLEVYNTFSGRHDRFAGAGVGFKDGDGNTALFNAPLGIALDSLNHVMYLCDRGNHAIRRLTVPVAGVASGVAAGTSASALAVLAKLETARPPVASAGDNKDKKLAVEDREAAWRDYASVAAELLTGLAQENERLKKANQINTDELLALHKAAIERLTNL